MVNKCSAYGCKSGYSGTTPDGVTLHRYPLHNPSLLDKWIRANPRKDFVPTQNSRICSLHFSVNDFVEFTQDSNLHRRKSDDKLERRYLRPEAVPTIFPNAPGYLSTTPQAERSTSSATSAARLDNDANRLENQISSFLADDSISNRSLQDIKELLDSEESRPAGFHTSISDGHLCIYMLEVKQLCQIGCYICIGPNNDVSIGVNGSAFSSDKIADFCGIDGKISSLTEILNLMARVKNLKEDLDRSDLEESPEDLARRQSDHFLDMAECNLESMLERKDDRQVAFLLEQLKLSRKAKSARSYSQELIVLSYMLYSTSAAAYGVLRQQEILCLPSDRTLRSVTRRVGPDGLDTRSYLKLRASKLSQMERAVVLIIDEIYVANRIEYCSGQVSGVDDEGAIASTYCCFMIKSVAGSYKDMVSMHAVATLTARKLHEWFRDTMELLRSLQFSVIAISTDNAPVNRKFITDFLCHGVPKPSIVDEVTGQPIFLLFDPVHNLKNIYNNFQARKIFRCPAFPPVLKQNCDARFEHITELHDAEASKPLRLAHKLNPTVLNPKSIEKSSVKLAVAVFCESTRDALNYYTKHEGRNWSGTADFIDLILKLWKILNVKTASKGLRKRDIMQDPVRSSLDWKLQFLEEFASFLQAWEASGERGLSKETFFACRLTCLALAGCARHLLDREGFSYVLLGALQSDSIERRFGWLRQMSGANYFISARQLTENNRKIAALSLLKFSQLSLGDIDSAIVSTTEDHATAELVRELAGKMEMTIQPGSSDATIIYYVSGALAKRFVQSKRGCEHCREILLVSEALPLLEAEGSLPPEATAFLDSVNRGGLSKPTEVAFGLARHCWQVFEEIRRSNDLRRKLLCASNQMVLFCKLVDELTDDSLFLESFFGRTMCTNGHNIKEGITKSFFNCMMKNLAKDLSALGSEAKRKRRSAKLSSAISDK